MRIYISGPITGVENYRENFRKAKEALCERGYTNVINPAELCQVLPAAHTTYHEYMQICIHLINLADVIEKPVEKLKTFADDRKMIDFE